MHSPGRIQQSNRIGKFLQWIAGVLAWLILTPTIILAFVSTLDHLDLLPESSSLHGIDFLPAFWLLIPIITGLLLMVLAGRRRVPLAIGGLSLLYIVLCGDVSFAEFGRAFVRVDPAAEHLRVAALNVQYYSCGVDSVAAALKKMDADVILLSENSFDSSDQETRFVRSMAPMHYYAGHKNSTAILSRYPIIAAEEVELPSHEASLSGGNDITDQASHPHRSFVHAVLNVHGNRLHAISIRLIAGRPKDHSFAENIKWGKYLLASQVKEESFFERYARNLKGPVIFGGDLNAPPTSTVMRRFSRFATDSFLVDHLWGELTFRTEFPTLRLDYIFSMNGAIPVHSERVTCFVSDHFPVRSEFALQPDRPGQLGLNAR